LRWYPASWRERFGDEFLVFLEDELGDARPTIAFRASVAGAGVRERARELHRAWNPRAPRERVTAGMLLVLTAWAVFIVAGASFSKLSEHFDQAVPAASRDLPWGAFKAIQIGAIVAAILVGIGAIATLPAFVRFLRDGGWPRVSRHASRATALTIVAIAATGGMVAWANSLSNVQRNGGDGTYGLAFVAWAVLLVVTLTLWTIVALAIGRRLTLTRSVLALEAWLAGAITTAMIVMTVATAIWWTAIASDAPWFLHGTTQGSTGSAFEPRLAVTVAVMLLAVSAAACGTIRVARAWNELRTA
jgi:hypothetical protein